MNINTVDLNLFLAFHAIYSAHSVTQAGEQLGMTQSAVSNALKRLRERFNDPLFVRTPEGMVPTPLAQRLIGPIDAGLAQFNQAIDQSQYFHPDHSSRLFRLAVNEVGHQVMVPRLLQQARERAPGVRFETVDGTPGEIRQQMRSGEVDLAIGSGEAMGQTFYQQRLFDECFLVLMRRSHPYHASGGGAAQYLAAEHLSYRPQGGTDHELQQRLRRAGLLEQRRVVLAASHSLGLAQMVRQADLLLTLPERLARNLVQEHPELVAMPLPFEMAPFTITQQWHERVHQDGGHRWLRELVFGLFHAAVPARKRQHEWAALAAAA